MAEILLVDDEPGVREAVGTLLRHRGHTVTTAESGEAGEALFSRRTFDLAILDVALPGIDGVETLTRLKRRDPGAVVVFITAFGSIKSAVDAIRAGGFDYVTKPFDNDDLLLAIDRALEHRALQCKVSNLQEDLAVRDVFPDIVGHSERLRAVLRQLARVAPTDATVLLLGESGTGKELAARSLHRYSRRHSGPFIAINCGAIPNHVAEAELFGHEAGAFTDAKRRRVGRLEAAHRGTVFLDEVGELPTEVQAKLLRTLQEGETQRLGADTPGRIDVRVVAATNQDLQAAVKAGRFREDLYWRLEQFKVVMPPLRERREDVPALVRHVVDKLNAELGADIAGVSDAVMQALTAHAWPGNVRELENVLRRAMLLADTNVIAAVELMEPASDQRESGRPQADSLAMRLKAVSDSVERDAIHDAMQRHRGHREKVAHDLGISRRTLFTKLQRYGLGDDASRE